MRFTDLPIIISVGMAVSASPLSAAAATGDLVEGVAGGNMIAAGVWASPDGSTVTYESSFFTPYQSVTAADMLRWVPGGAALLPNDRNNNQQDKRGFGSGGDQILINGKRISGKSNDINSAIQRIQASVVSRIEVIRGTSAGLDVRSEGTLINIVLAEAVSGGSGSWQLHSGFYGDSPEYDGLVSYSNSAGSLNYLVSAEYGPYDRGESVGRFEQYFDAGDGSLFETRDIERPQINTAAVFNTSASWDLVNGDVINVNARIEDAEREQLETTRVSVVGDPDVELLQNTALEDSLNWELGGDLENRLGANGVLKTRAIYTSKKEDESESVSLSSAVPGNVPSRSLVSTDSLATEAIIRTSLGWPVAARQNLEIGIEGALNSLEKNVLLFEVLPDGSLDPVDVFNSDSDVEENRYEFFSTHFWQLRDNITLESALNFEYSKIEQIGADIDNARTFTYIKPRFDLRWDLNDANQIRGSLERTVSQLDFGDFVATFDDDNDQVTAGNPDLEPEKAWEWKLTIERRLANDGGVLATELFFNQIEDHIDRIAATSTTSAAGNIGDARVYGGFLRGSMRLAPLGLEGAVIDAEYRFQNSRTTDPFTGAERRMLRKPRHRYTIKFRHDVPVWKLNYSVDVEWFAERVTTDINYHDRNESLTPRLSANAQYRLTDKLVLWFDARRVLDEDFRRIRERYTGNIADGNLLRTEVREEYRRSTFILGLRGQF